MKNLPKYYPIPTRSDKQLEWLGYLLLVASWIFAIWAYAESPEQIVVHYNIKGQPDGYGNKITLLILPLIGTLCFFGMTWLNSYPHLFNYPTKITPENMEFQYRAAIRLIRWLKICILLIFMLITLAIYQSASQNNAIGIMAWLIPTILAITFLPLIFYFLHQSPKKSKK
ncbi:MAG: DUF1648 domain-containing protein [Bacteroidales bacterium]